MNRFQIRDETFGLALYDAETATDALADFLADRERGRLRPLIEETDAGDGATVELDGQRYRALRVPD